MIHSHKKITEKKTYKGLYKTTKNYKQTNNFTKQDHTNSFTVKKVHCTCDTKSTTHHYSVVYYGLSIQVTEIYD